MTIPVQKEIHKVAENFKNKKGLPITKQILEDIHKLYLGSQIAEDELHKKAPSIEGAVMEASFATEISNYFSRICTMSHTFMEKDGVSY